MNVSEPCGNGPAPGVFNNIFVNAVYGECHGTNCSQRVITDAQRGSARVELSTEYDNLPKCWCDVGGGDMLDVSDVTDYKNCILSFHEIGVMYMFGNLFYEADGVVNGIMVNGAASFPVFLIFQIAAHILCFLELFQRSCMGQYSALFKEMYVLSPELHFTGP